MRDIKNLITGPGVYRDTHGDIWEYIKTEKGVGPLDADNFVMRNRDTNQMATFTPLGFPLLSCFPDIIGCLYTLYTNKVNPWLYGDECIPADREIKWTGSPCKYLCMTSSGKYVIEEPNGDVDTCYAINKPGISWSNAKCDAIVIDTNKKVTVKFSISAEGVRGHSANSIADKYSKIILDALNSADKNKV